MAKSPAMVYGVDYGPGSSKKKKATTQPTPATPPKATTPPAMFQGANDQANYWNDYAKQHTNDGSNLIKNSPYAGVTGKFVNDIASGDMSHNPFMSNVYDKTKDANLGDTQKLLEQFLAGSGQIGTGGVRPGSGVGQYGPWSSSGASGSSGSGVGSGGGGVVPDTVGGSNSFFAQHIKDLFDPSRLDPANDPTLAPLLASLREQNQQNLMSSLGDLNASAEQGGRYGGSDWAAQNVGARGRAIQSLDQTTATTEMAARQAALQAQMEGLGLTNTRDLGAMQDATNRFGISTNAAVAGAGQAQAAADANAGRQLQAIQAMMQGNQFGLGLQGDMANTLQSGQLGALGIGNARDQLGLSALGLDQNNAQLGLGAVGQMNNAASGLGSYKVGQGNISLGMAGLRQGADQFQQQMQQQSLMNYFNMLQGIGGMGGDAASTTPGSYTPSGMDPNMAAIMGLFGGGLSSYGQQQGHA